jgi:hypothetical protein
MRLVGQRSPDDAGDASEAFGRGLCRYATCGDRGAQRIVVVNVFGWHSLDKLLTCRAPIPTGPLLPLSTTARLAAGLEVWYSPVLNRGTRRTSGTHPSGSRCGGSVPLHRGQRKLPQKTMKPPVENEGFKVKVERAAMSLSLGGAAHNAALDHRTDDDARGIEPTAAATTGQDRHRAQAFADDGTALVDR